MVAFSGLDSPKREDGEWTVGLMGPTVSQGRAPEIVPEQLQQGSRGQDVGVGFDGATDGEERWFASDIGIIFYC